jgi:hypothetical protein
MVSLFTALQNSKDFGLTKPKFGIIKGLLQTIGNRERKLARSLGACKYVVAEYDKVKRIVIPAGKNHILYVTTTASFDHNKIICKVRSFR